MKSWAAIVAEEDLENSQDGLNLALRELARFEETGEPGEPAKPRLKIEARIDKTGKNKRLTWKSALLQEQHFVEQESKARREREQREKAEIEKIQQREGEEKEEKEKESPTQSETVYVGRKRVASEISSKQHQVEEEKEENRAMESDNNAQVVKMIQAATSIGRWGDESDDEEDEEEASTDCRSSTSTWRKYPPQPIEELTEERIEKRQKQIDLGKSTDGYKNYVASVSRENRTDSPRCPNTPDKTAKISKRTWMKQVSQWRRALHHWDNEDAEKPNVVTPKRQLFNKHSSKRQRPTPSVAQQ